MKTVELVQAFLWVCDECGRDNFERATRLEPESMEGQEAAEFAGRVVAEANDAAEDLGIEADGDWLVAPTRVRCKHCGAGFDVAAND